MTGADLKPLLIAGGGIGGLAAALALARVGRASLVLERRETWSEAGAGIQLSPNAVRVLELLGVAGSLAASAGVPREILVRSAGSARVLQRLPLGDWIAARHGAPYWQVHRRDLQAALVSAVNAEPLVRIVPGFEAMRYEVREPDVVLHDGRGGTVEGAALIGADGVFSRVRAQLLGSPPPRFSGRVAARTVVPFDRLPAGAGLLDGATTGVWLAPGAHIVHYPVCAGRELALVVVTREAWSGQGWSEPVTAGVIERVIARVAPALALALGEGWTWRRWALFEATPLDAWSAGPVALLGDAAHPTLPFFAQGGAMALEDAATLAAALSKAGRADIPAALAAYAAARRERTRRIVDVARRNGMVFHLGGPAALARNLVMQALPGTRVMAGFDWVYGWRPPLA